MNTALLCTTSAAAGNGLGKTTKYLRKTTSGTASICLGAPRLIQRATRAKITLLRCTSAGLLFSCCDRAPRHRGNDLGTTIKHLRKTTSGAAGIGHDHAHPDNSTLQTGKNYSTPLHITKIFFSCCDSVAAPRATTWAQRSSFCQKSSGAAGIGLGNTAKYLRSETDAAAGNGMGTTLSYLLGTADNGRTQR